MRKVTVLKTSPRVVQIDDFLSEEERDHLILHSTPHLKRSEVVDPDSGDGTTNEYRTGLNHCFQRGQDLVIQGIEQKIADACAVRVLQLEFLQVNKYEVGHEFKPHQDWLDEKTPGHQKQLAQGGQRTLSVIVYLKAPEEGGDTLFETLNLRVKPTPLSALLWYNVNDKVEPDHRVVHAGLPVTKGEKWILTCWIRERAHDGSEEAAHKARKEKEAESKQVLEDKLKEMRRKNRQEGFMEVMAICRRRELIMSPEPAFTKDGRVGATLDLIDPKFPEERD